MYVVKNVKLKSIVTDEKYEELLKFIRDEPKRNCLKKFKLLQKATKSYVIP